MDYPGLLKTFGINQTYIAEKMGIGEGLLRHYLSKDPLEPTFKKKFIKIIKENNQALMKAIKEKN